MPYPNLLSAAHTIRDLVAKNLLPEALEELVKVIEQRPELHKLLMQSARYSDLNEKISLGIIDNEYAGVEMNRIRKALIDLVWDMEKEAKADIQVFISYSRNGDSKKLAKLLHDSIEAKGFIAFLDIEDLSPGEDWAKFILGSLRASDYFILLLSEAANTSEMVNKEVEEAIRLREIYGKPRILPVRVNWPEKLQPNYKLSQHLKRIQQLSWKGEEDTEKVVQEILGVIGSRRKMEKVEEVSEEDAQGFAEDTQGPPIPVAPLEVPQGAVILDSPFYIQREGEERFIKRIDDQKTLLRIRGPRQYGKTSLLSRIINYAYTEGYQVISMDFQSFGNRTLSNLDNLLWEFCWKISEKMDLDDDFEDYWDNKLKRKPDRDKKQLIQLFIERKVLPTLDKDLVLAMDEVDRVFPYKDVSDEFFLMLRSWHEESTTNPIWKKFKMAISYSTEAKLAISNLNASPFNIGIEARLQPFDEEQMNHLVQVHGLGLSADQKENLLALVGGQPYLVRRALFLLASHEISYENLMETSATDQGPFSDHLRHHLINLRQFPELIEAMKGIIQNGKCKDPVLVGRLNAAGLVLGTPPAAIHPACKLYADYFKDKLS